MYADRYAKHGARRALLALLALALLSSACTQMATSGYSARHAPVSAWDAGAAEHAGLVPRACLADDVQGDVARLPPGCANALNLMQMVERPADLRQGRQMGPAYGAPAAQAIERYLGVEREEELEARRRERLEREAATRKP